MLIKNDINGWREVICKILLEDVFFNWVLIRYCYVIEKYCDRELVDIKNI